MAVDTRIKTKVERVQDYFTRQYELEEGSTEKNVRALFSKDLVYHLGEDEVMSLEDLIRAADRIRRSPREERRVTISGLREAGDRVYFRMELEMLDPETNRRVELASDHDWRFDESGLVVEVRPTDVKSVSQAFEAMEIRRR